MRWFYLRNIWYDTRIKCGTNGNNILIRLVVHTKCYIWTRKCGHPFMFSSRILRNFMQRTTSRHNLVIWQPIILITSFLLGFLVDFVSNPVVSGFTSAGAITIASAQVKNLFGIPNLKSSTFANFCYNLVLNISDIALWDTLLGVCCIIFLLYFRVRSRQCFLQRSKLIRIIFRNSKITARRLLARKMTKREIILETFYGFVRYRGTHLLSPLRRS